MIPSPADIGGAQLFPSRPLAATIIPVIQFLSQLVQAQSTLDKGEVAASQVISDYFGRHGVPCSIDTWDTTRSNCIAHLRSSGRKKALLFACHHDVVPPGDSEWRYPPFSGVIDAGKVHGRGSTDMKGGTAAAATAICEIVAEGVPLEGDVVFAATAGEETDGCGIRRFVEARADLPDFAGVIVPEPTGFEIVSAHRGLLWLNIVTKGKTAHGSTPHLGINAISSMKQVLDLLAEFSIEAEPHPRLGSCSMSINTIEAGKALNVIPDRCTLGIDFRTLPGQASQDIIDRLEAMLVKLDERHAEFEASISIIRSVGSIETDTEHEFVKGFCATVDIKETRAVGYTTDAPFLTPLGAPILIFGPGDGSMCHQPNEYIEITAVERAVAYYKKIIIEFLT